MRFGPPRMEPRANVTEWIKQELPHYYTTRFAFFIPDPRPRTAGPRVQTWE